MRATKNSNKSAARGGSSARSVADAPPRAEQRGPVAAALACDERRNGGQVIRLERVAHAEQRSKARAGGEVEERHRRIDCRTDDLFRHLYERGASFT
jgi:hypothetical protein